MEMKLDYSDVAFRNDGKLKLLIIVGTRPEIIRLAAVINKCRKYFDCILAHTGQNYDYNLNGIFFRDESGYSAIRLPGHSTSRNVAGT